MKSLNDHQCWLRFEELVMHSRKAYYPVTRRVDSLSFRGAGAEPASPDFLPRTGGAGEGLTPGQQLALLALRDWDVSRQVSDALARRSTARATQADKDELVRQRLAHRKASGSLVLTPIGHWRANWLTRDLAREFNIPGAFSPGITRNNYTRNVKSRFNPW